MVGRQIFFREPEDKTDYSALLGMDLDTDAAMPVKSEICLEENENSSTPQTSEDINEEIVFDIGDVKEDAQINDVQVYDTQADDAQADYAQVDSVQVLDAQNHDHVPKQEISQTGNGRKSTK